MQLDPRRSVVAVVLLLAGAAVANTLLLRRPAEVRYTASFDRVPLEIGDLKGAPAPVEQRIYEYLDADAMMDINYQGPHKTEASLSLIYGSDWRTVHSPLSCFQQQGWLVDETREIEIPAPPDCPHPGPLKARMLRVHKSTQSLLALYSFAHKGGTEADWTRQSLAVAATPPGTGGVIIALSTPYGEHGLQAAMERAQLLLSTAYGPAVSFWYAEDRARGGQ